MEAGTLLVRKGYTIKICYKTEIGRHSDVLLLKPYPWGAQDLFVTGL